MKYEEIINASRFMFQMTKDIPGSPISVLIVALWPPPHIIFRVHSLFFVRSSQHHTHSQWSDEWAGESIFLEGPKWFVDLAIWTAFLSLFWYAPVWELSWPCFSEICVCSTVQLSAFFSHTFSFVFFGEIMELWSISHNLEPLWVVSIYTV